MIYAEGREAVEQARLVSPASGSCDCQAVYQSFEEAGDQLFTFTGFPLAQWKALRTTNALERINEEFLRRTKTQASLPSEEAVLLLMFGRLRSGQIKLRRIVGWYELDSAAQQRTLHEGRKIAHGWRCFIAFPPNERHYPLD
jgi:putative transposase